MGEFRDGKATKNWKDGVTKYWSGGTQEYQNTPAAGRCVTDRDARFGRRARRMLIGVRGTSLFGDGCGKERQQPIKVNLGRNGFPKPSVE